jgi:ribosome-binding protein aMBF1 (putative translation factor)
MAKRTAGIANRLGKAIASERTARELTQEQLAEMLGVEQETISRFERGTTLPPLPRLIQLGVCAADRNWGGERLTSNAYV